MNKTTLPDPILVGRKSELEELKRFLDLALKGKGTTVFISGEAGSGKTRLINEFLKVAKKKVPAILFGSCLSNAKWPYFPFIEAFASDFSKGRKENRSISSQQRWMTSLLSEPHSIGERGESKILAPQVWKDQAFLAVTKDLLFISSAKSVILVLEDMHWADSASLALLHYISRAIVSERVLVLVTFRSEELSCDVDGNPHPLAETIHLMGREGLFREIKLESLARDDVGRIAESMLGGKVERKLVERLSEESRGNPLFVVELLRMLAERRSLVRDMDQWRLPVDRLGVPSKVKEIILRRISALRPEQRRILDVASVIGETFDSDIIGLVLSKDRLEVLEVLNGILQSTSLISFVENVYGFDHAKSREVLYEEISLPLKQEYHARIAQQIENASPNGVALSSLAYHYARAGNIEKSVKYALVAGQEALARYSNVEAIKHFKYVLESTANLDELVVERKAALEGLGDAYYANCMFEEAIRTFESLACSETGVVRLRAYRKAMEIVWYKEMDSVRLMELVKKAEKYVASDRLESARVRWNRGRALTWFGDFKAALKDHEEALRIFEEEYSLPDIAHVLLGIGISRIMCGTNLEKGVGELLRSVALCHDLGDIRGEIITTIYRDYGFHLVGLIEDLVSKYNYVLELGKKIGDFENMADAAFSLGTILQVRNKPEEAKNYLLKALDYAEKTDAKGLQSRICAELTTVHAKLEDLKQSEYYFGMLKKMPPEILAHPRNHYSISIAEAVSLAAKKQWRDANWRFEKIGEMLKTRLFNFAGYELGWRNNYAWALEMQGRAGAASFQREENLKILARVQERFSHVKLQANLLLQRQVNVGEEFEVCLDIINASTKPMSILTVKNMILADVFKVSALPSYCCMQDEDIEIKPREIGAFQVEIIKLSLRALQAGVSILSPQVVYIDNQGKTRTCKVKPVNIMVKPALSISKEEEAEVTVSKIIFKSEAAQKAFDFLVNAFVQDYSQRRLPREKSGWRTLMDIVKQAGVSQYSMYRSKGRRGLALSELEQLGLVDVRIFYGERGRGGKIIKLRVSYDRENVRLYIEQRT